MNFSFFLKFEQEKSAPNLTQFTEIYRVTVNVERERKMDIISRGNGKRRVQNVLHIVAMLIGGHNVHFCSCYLCEAIINQIMSASHGTNQPLSSQQVRAAQHYFT